MSFRDALLRIDLEQLLAMADIPEDLVLPGDRHDALARVSAFAAYLQGNVTWDSVTETALAQPDLREAIRLSEECGRAGGQLSDSTRARLQQSWAAWVSAIDERRKVALTRLELVPPEAPQATAQAKEFVELLESQDPMRNPLTTNGYLGAQDLEENLLVDLLDREPSTDLDALMELAELEIAQDWEELVQASTHAWQRLLRAATREGSQGPTRRLLAALPTLVLERRLDDVRALSADDPDYRALEVALELPTEAPPPRPARVSMASGSRARASGEFRQLRKFSEAVVLAAPDDGRPLECAAELADLSKRAEQQPSFTAESRLWLGASKASQGEWAKRTLGRGLLAAGRARMEDDNLQQARPLFLDALELLGTHELDPDVFRTAVRLTLGARVWPHHRARLVATNDSSVRRWAQDPSLPFARDDVLPADLIDQAALIWADDLSDDRVGELFLRSVGSELGDDATLYRRCLERLITPARLRRDPRRVCDRLLWLLADARPAPSLATLLDRLTQELGELASNERSKSVSKRILDLLPEISLELDGLPLHTVAPVADAKEVLPTALEYVVGAKGGLAEEAQLSVVPLCRAFYPEERSRELLLPVLIKNADQAGRARNVQLALRLEEKLGPTPPIRLLESRRTTPDLEPGDEQELIFYFDVDPDIHERMTEVRLIPEIRTEERVQRARTFSIEFRPSGLRPSRKSPFTTGLAVGADRFVGRRRELERLVEFIVSDVRRVPVVVGIRRIGKTSLVRKALRDPEVVRQFYSKYWDVEARPDSDSSADFLSDLAETIRDAIPARYHSRLRFSREPLRQRPYQAFDDFIQSIEEAALPKRTLVVIDECDRLLKLVEEGRERQLREGRPLTPQEAFQPEVFGALRRALMTTERFSLVLAGLPALVRSAGYENRLFGLMSSLQLRPFSTEEATEVMDAAKPFMEFSLAARNYAFRTTGLQPYLLQVLCDSLFHRMKDHGRDVVAPADVQEVIEEQLLPNESNLADYVSLIEEDWEILFGLAEALAAAPQSRRYVSVHEVGHALQQHGLEWSEPDIQEALGRLVPSVGDDVVDRPLVERAPNDRSRFRLVVGLLGEYLRETGPYR